MEELGPLADLWEGKYQGEGIIPSVKQALGNGLRGNWQQRFLTTLLQEKAMKAVMHQYRTEEEVAQEFLSQMDQSLHFHTYPNGLSLTSSYHEGKALSAVLLRDGCMGCAISNGRIVWLSITGNEVRTVLTMQYRLWTLEDTEADFSKEDVVASLLFLPMPILQAPPMTGLYTVINSRWD